MQKPLTKGSARRSALFGIAAIAVLAGLALIAQQRSGGPAKHEAASVRTATIVKGDLEKTIRISGVITAEKFASLMAPRLRGSRGASGSYGGGKSLIGNASSSSSSSSTSSTTSSSSSNSTSSSTSSADTSSQSNANSGSTNTALNGQNATSGAPGAPQSSLGAIRGTTNRFSDRTAAAQANSTQANASSTSSGSTSSTASSGTSGLGSTASNLIGTGGSMGSGGGGGAGAGGSTGSDFSLVLVSVAKAGGHVKKGELVAEFDRQYQLNRLDDYKATVVQLDANLTKLKADLATAKKAHEQLVGSAKGDWDKALLDLKTAEVRSAIESEDLKLAANEAEARYKQLVEEAKLLEASQHSQILASQIDRDQAKIELDRATVNVDRMVVRAPIDGIVVMQTIWRGGDFGQVQQGDQVWPGMTFMQIVDPRSMVLMANLNQVDAESVRLGMQAKVGLDAYPGVRFPGRIIGVAAMTKPGAWRPDYMRELSVRIKLDAIDERVIPDLSASAEILLASEKQATLVPLNAVFRENPGAVPFVFLRTPSGWERRDVQIGLENHIAAVAQSGVAAGDVVAAERPPAGKPAS